MSPSVHRLLVHGVQVSRLLPLPPAYFAEDAGESWHKIYRRNWIYHARQCSRAARILDLFKRALGVTDHIIVFAHTEMRLKMHKLKEIPPETKDYLILL